MANGRNRTMLFCVLFIYLLQPSINLLGKSSSAPKSVLKWTNCLFFFHSEHNLYLLGTYSVHLDCKICNRIVFLTEQQCQIFEFLNFSCHYYMLWGRATGGRKCKVVNVITEQLENWSTYLGSILYWLLGKGVGNSDLRNGFSSWPWAKPCRALSRVVMLPPIPCNVKLSLDTPHILDVTFLLMSEFSTNVSIWFLFDCIKC